MASWSDLQSMVQVMDLLESIKPLDKQICMVPSQWSLGGWVALQEWACSWLVHHFLWFRSISGQAAHGIDLQRDIFIMVLPRPDLTFGHAPLSFRRFLASG